MKGSKDGNWLTLKEAAQLTGRGETTIGTWISEGHLPKGAVRREPLPNGFRYRVKAEAVLALAQRPRAGQNWPTIKQAAERFPPTKGTIHGWIRDGVVRKHEVWEEPTNRGFRYRIDPRALRRLTRQRPRHGRRRREAGFVCLEEVLNWSQEEASVFAKEMRLLRKLASTDPPRGSLSAKDAIKAIRSVGNRILEDGPATKLSFRERSTLEALANYPQEYELEPQGRVRKGRRTPVEPVITVRGERVRLSEIKLGPFARPRTVDEQTESALIARADDILRLRMAARAMWPLLAEGGNVTLRRCSGCKQLWVADDRVGAPQTHCPYCGSPALA